MGSIITNIEINEFGLPVGPAVKGWKPPVRPPHQVLEGWGCLLEPLSHSKHTQDLFKAFQADRENRMWGYLTIGPFSTPEALEQWIAGKENGTDPLFYAICDAALGTALGFASYLRIDPALGSIEVGWLTYSPALQRNRLATVAMYLLMEHAFSLGYRRYEWKCNSLNAPSRRAAARLGFSYEGTFRQARIDRDHSRDTSWFSIIDAEWPMLKAAYQQWLVPENFSEDGQQKLALSDLTRPIVKAWHPFDI